MANHIQVNFGHPVNTAILRYLAANTGRNNALLEDAPSAFDKTFYDELGTHPDLVYLLWHQVSAKLPVECRWVVFARPVLVHPTTGVIFAFAGGTHYCGFRVPPSMYPIVSVAKSKWLEGKTNNSRSNLDELGEEWSSFLWLNDLENFGLLAYQYAGELPTFEGLVDTSWYDATLHAQQIVAEIEADDLSNFTILSANIPPEPQLQNQIKHSQKLAQKAHDLINKRLDLSLLLSLEAYRSVPTYEAKNSLLEGLSLNNDLLSFLSGHTLSVNGVAFSPNGQLLASGGADRLVILWDLVNYFPLLKLEGHTKQVQSVDFSPDGKILVSGGLDKTVILWDVESGKQFHQFEGFTLGVLSVAFSPDGKIMVAATASGTITLFDTDTLALITQFEENNYSVNQVVFDSSSKILAAAKSDGIITLWNIEQKQPMRFLRGHKGGVNSISFSPDNKMLVSSGTDQLILFWDITNDQPFERIKNEWDILSIAYSSDGKSIASGGGSELLTLKDLDPNPAKAQFLKGHSGNINSVAYSPDGKTLASGGLDSKVIIWDINPESWQKKAGKIANRNLTEAEWKLYFGSEPYRKTFPDLL